MKRRKSLVVKVFLFTAGLLLGISLLTWILIASFLPSTYKNELENRLAAAAGELVEELEQYDSWEKAENLLQLFAATNQAGVKLLDEEGEILFSDSWIDMEEDMVGMAVEAAEEPEPPAIHSVRDGAETGAEETECAWNGAVISELDREASPNGEDNVAVVTEENILAGDLAEKEGTSAMKFYPVKIGEEEGTLLLFGTMKSVSQAMAVLKRLLPMIFLVVLAVSLLCAAGASVYLASPIRRLSRVAGEMAALNFQEKCPVGRSDEIGFLGESLNELSGNLDQALNELKESNQKLRSFFAAASHELKTPVTVLKGHLGGDVCKAGSLPESGRVSAPFLSGGREHGGNDPGNSGGIQDGVRDMAGIQRTSGSGRAFAEPDSAALGACRRKRTSPGASGSRAPFLPG